MPSVEESVSNMHSVYQERSAAKYKMDFAELEDIRRSVAEMHLALSKKAIRKVTTETRSTINLNSGPQANLNITVDSRSASAASLNRPRLDTVCGICSKIGYYSCSVCGKVYCSEQCQREDWPSHRSICSSSSNHVPPEQQNNSPERPTSIDRSRNNSQRSPHSPQTREVNVQPSLPKLKKQDITFGVKIQVTAIDIEDISRFFLQTDSDAAALVSIQSSLQETCNGNVPGFRPQVGDICAAKYDADGQWYRAKILTFQDNQYNIRFIDYGNSSTVSVADTCPLPTSFFELPPQAFQCKLTSLVPASGKQSEVLERLQNFLVTVPLFAKFINCIDDVYEVELYNDQGTSFVSKAVSDGIAKAQQPVSKNEGFKRENHVAPSRDSNHIPSVLSKFGPGETIEMCVTVSDKDGVWGMVISNTNIFQAAMDVEEKLNADCPTQVQNNTFRPSLGQYVAVRSKNNNNRWCRAVITSLSSLSVLFVDYGTNEEVVSDVLPLKPEYFAVCSTAVNVTASNQYDMQYIARLYPVHSRLTMKTMDRTGVNMKAVLTDEEDRFLLLLSPWYHDLEFISEKLVKRILVENQMAPQELTDEPKITALPCSSESSYLVKEHRLEDVTPVSIAKDYQEPAKVSRSDMTVSERLKKALTNASRNVGRLATVSGCIEGRLLPEEKIKVNVAWVEDTILYLQVDSEADELDRLMKELNKSVKALPVPEEIKPGDFVAALFDEDYLYYRAKVLEVIGRFCKVVFVDYGNKAEVPCRTLKVLTDEFLKPSAFAYCVRLQEVSEIPEFVGLALVREPVYVKVADNGVNPPSVHLYDQEGQCINKILMS